MGVFRHSTCLDEDTRVPHHSHHAPTEARAGKQIRSPDTAVSGPRNVPAPQSETVLRTARHAFRQPRLERASLGRDRPGRPFYKRAGGEGGRAVLRYPLQERSGLWVIMICGWRGPG